ncbi:hypothetical protein V6N12_050194 [Hibiscus sabdariffa]|uniref:hAT-like transposase RNase-H fold domain-containing protein n=1 Tax=Hibiscus sabdariffa TaxID=183260 RepID=A0ABR2GBN8_9ROSI
MGRQMRENFDRYYGELGKTNVMMLVALVLEPRYKLRFVRFSLRKLFPLDFTKVDAMCNHLYDVIQKLYDFYNARISSSSKNSAHGSKLQRMDVDGSENAMPSQNENLNNLYNEFNEEDAEDQLTGYPVLVPVPTNIETNPWNLRPSRSGTGSNFQEFVTTEIGTNSRQIDRVPGLAHPYWEGYTWFYYSCNG